MFSTQSRSGAGRVVGTLCLLLAVTVGVATVGCGKKVHRGASAPAPIEPEDLKELIANLAKKKSVGLIKDLRIPSARRLGEGGAASQEAIPALEKMAQDKDPEVKAAAEDALKKIKGG